MTAQLFDLPKAPKNWKEFEEAVTALGYGISVKDWSGVGTDRRFSFHFFVHSWDLRQSHPYRENLRLDYGMELHKYVDAKDKNVAKREIFAQASQILIEIKQRIERLDRLWPVLNLLCDRNNGLKYGQENFELHANCIDVTHYDYKVSILDTTCQLTVDQVTVVTRNANVTKNELQALIDRIDRVREEYTLFLEEPGKALLNSKKGGTDEEAGLSNETATG